MSKIEYRFLGNLSSTPPGRSVFLWCDRCKVCWEGCQDAFECPECGDSEAWEEQQERRAAETKAAKPDEYTTLDALQRGAM